MIPPIRRSRPLVHLVTALAVILVIAGVALVVAQRWQSSRTATATTSVPPAGAKAVPPEPAVVGDAANGSTLHLRPGQTLRVVLGAPATAGSTYWSFAPVPTGGALAALSGPTVTPERSAAGCSRAGMGCGTVALTLTARSTGTAQVTASRSACGEARPCPPGQDSFRLTVVVAG